jgi:hypothetical protein
VALLYPVPEDQSGTMEIWIRAEGPLGNVILLEITNEDLGYLNKRLNIG